MVSRPLCRHADPNIDRPDYDAPRKTLHVGLRSVCPPKVHGRDWTDEDRDAFGQTVIDQIANYSPNFKSLILDVEVRTPREIENEVGLTEGNIFQGELTTDQLFMNRPFPAMRSTADR